METRQFKFRVWDGKVMWGRGSIQFDMMPFGLSKQTFFEFEGIESGEIVVGNHTRDFVPLQFTGVNDSNGKEIYEGDVVRILYGDYPDQPAEDPRTYAEYKLAYSEVGVVVFDGGAFILKFPVSHGGLQEGKHGRKEVLGNIYENPKLNDLIK